MNEERAHEVVEHLQAAMLELIEAARAALDVAEDFVKEPGDAVALATVLAAKAAAARPQPEGDAAGTVERIRVS